jgi:hypothetical protein
MFSLFPLNHVAKIPCKQQEIPLVQLGFQIVLFFFQKTRENFNFHMGTPPLYGIHDILPLFIVLWEHPGHSHDYERGASFFRAQLKPFFSPKLLKNFTKCIKQDMK